MLAVALVATLAVVAGDAAAASRGLTFRELTTGSRAAIVPGEREGAFGRVLRSRSQAARALRALHMPGVSTSGVDFARESLIVAVAPFAPTGGYRARVSRIAVEGRRAVLTASVAYEGGDFATQALERPWVLVAVRRSALARASDAVRIRLR